MIKKKVIMIFGMLGVLLLITFGMNLNLTDGKKEKNGNEFSGHDAQPLSKKALDCMTCHSKQTTFKAKDTIDRAACDNCHKEDIEFLIPISTDVHNFHQGNISKLPAANYIERHKKDINVSCDNCHTFSTSESPECRLCHKGNDHVDNRDRNCISCHGFLNEMFKHKTINLVTHDKFGENSCTAMCHSDDKTSLRLINNIPISIIDSSRLCKQCHYGTYKSWQDNGHYSGSCVDCHNPHAPAIYKKE